MVVAGLVVAGAVVAGLVVMGMVAAGIVSELVCAGPQATSAALQHARSAAARAVILPGTQSPSR